MSLLLSSLQSRSASADDFISDDSDTKARKREGKKKQRERRDDGSGDDRDMDVEYGAFQPKARIENRAAVQLPDIGLPYSTDDKVMENKRELTAQEKSKRRFSITQNN